MRRPAWTAFGVLVVGCSRAAAPELVEPPAAPEVAAEVAEPAPEPPAFSPLTPDVIDAEQCQVVGRHALRYSDEAMRWVEAVSLGDRVVIVADDVGDRVFAATLDTRGTPINSGSFTLPGSDDGVLFTSVFRGNVVIYADGPCPDRAADTCLHIQMLNADGEPGRQLVSRALPGPVRTARAAQDSAGSFYVYLEYDDSAPTLGRWSPSSWKPEIVNIPEAVGSATAEDRIHWLAADGDHWAILRTRGDRIYLVTSTSSEVRLELDKDQIDDVSYFELHDGKVGVAGDGPGLDDWIAIFTIEGVRTLFVPAPPTRDLLPTPLDDVLVETSFAHANHTLHLIRRLPGGSLYHQPTVIEQSNWDAPAATATAWSGQGFVTAYINPGSRKSRLQTTFVTCDAP